MIAEGVRENGFGEGGNMLFGMGVAGAINPLNASMPAQGAVAQPTQTAPLSDAPAGQTLDEQVETLKKYKELLDAGIITQEEFDAKKRQVMGL